MWCLHKHCFPNYHVPVLVVRQEACNGNGAMTSLASTSSDTSPTVTPEQIAEATTLKQILALLDSVDPSGSQYTTKKQALAALIRHYGTIEQAKDASTVARSSATAPCTAIPTSPASSLRSLSSSEHSIQRLTPQPAVTEPHRWEEHHRRLKELDKRLDELDRRSRQLNLIVYSLPEDQEDPLTDIWHKIEEKDRLEMCVDGLPQRLGRCCPDHQTKAYTSEVWHNAWEA